MKRNYLGEFQEVVLLTILILDDNAYGVTIQNEIRERLGRSVSRGALHTALTRLTEKGLIDSKTGGASKQRGGRRKRFYQLTNQGKEALRDARDKRDQLWNAVPDFSMRMAF